MLNFRSPEMCFSFWQTIFSFARKRKMHFWASKILQNFAALKWKEKNKLVWWGLEPLAGGVVKKQLKEIDGERGAVDARGRALHREATVTLGKIFPILNINRFGAIVKTGKASKISIELLFRVLKIYYYIEYFYFYSIVVQLMRFSFIAGQQEQTTRRTLFTDLNEIKFSNKLRVLRLTVTLVKRQAAATHRSV